MFKMKQNVFKNLFILFYFLHFIKTFFYTKKKCTYINRTHNKQAFLNVYTNVQTQKRIEG